MTTVQTNFADDALQQNRATPTSSAGTVECVCTEDSDLAEGADTTPPFVTAQNPAEDETGVSISSNVFLRVDDAGVGVVKSTILVEIDKGSGYQTAYDGATDSFSAPYNGGGSSIVAGGTAGFDITIDHTTDFSQFTLIYVRTSAEDLNGNALVDYIYSFRTEDTGAPFLTNQDPAPGAPSVVKDTNILFKVDDAVSGVVQASIDVQVQVNAGPLVDAVINGAVVSPFNGAGSGVTASGLGFNVVLNRSTDFSHGDLVTVYVQAEDADSGVLDTSYSFTIFAAAATLSGSGSLLIEAVSAPPCLYQRSFDSGTDGYVYWLTTFAARTPSPEAEDTVPNYTGALSAYAIILPCQGIPISHYQRAYDDGTEGFVYWTSEDPDDSPVTTVPQFTGSLSNYVILRIDRE